MALKRSVEVSVEIRYRLRSMGVKVTSPSVIYEDNQSVCISDSDVSSGLNKKYVALDYHFTREHMANQVVSVRKISSENNYADAFTKALPVPRHKLLFEDLLTN